MSVCGNGCSLQAPNDIYAFFNNNAFMLLDLPYHGRNKWTNAYQEALWGYPCRLTIGINLVPQVLVHLKTPTDCGFPAYIQQLLSEKVKPSRLVPDICRTHPYPNLGRTWLVQAHGLFSPEDNLPHLYHNLKDKQGMNDKHAIQDYGRNGASWKYLAIKVIIWFCHATFY